LLCACGKHVVVLKDERRDVYQDAPDLFELTPPQRGCNRRQVGLW
jgi:hypothetical protein